MEKVIRRVQVHAPIGTLKDTDLKHFIDHGLNPEIAVDAIALERFTVDGFQAIAAEFHASRRTVTLHAPFWGLSPGIAES